MTVFVLFTKQEVNTEDSNSQSSCLNYVPFAHCLAGSSFNLLAPSWLGAKELVSRYLQLSGAKCLSNSIRKASLRCKSRGNLDWSNHICQAFLQMDWQWRQFSLGLEVQIFSSCEPGGKNYYTLGPVVTDKMNCTLRKHTWWFRG